MDKLVQMNAEQLRSFQSDSTQRYNRLKEKKLNLNMARGVPSPQQLDLTNELMTAVDGSNYKASDGMDCRTYGAPDGLPEVKTIFAAILEVNPDQVIVGGNSSLALMYDLITRAVLLGLPSSETPWSRSPVKFLCPSPGYDRHFAICDLLNIKMITVDMKQDGPDMDRVEQLVAEDPEIKGIWCVPKYSNPTGAVYSDAVVDRLARMRTKANDFLIMWDNAYAVHHLTDTPPKLKNIMQACKEAGNPDRVFMFASTSKISFSGGGVAALASSQTNIQWLKKLISIQTIGPDKLNQLRHARFYKDLSGVEAHMKKHAALLKPKFAKVDEVLTHELDGLGIASWTQPQGGYFISLDTMDGCAKQVVAMAKDAGVTLTPAGATFPYGKDPRDRNIRIAPTFPSVEDLATAMEILAVCVKLVSVEKLLHC